MLGEPLPAGIGDVLLERLDAVARCSAPGPGVTRLPFTPEHRAANSMIANWMAAAGLEVSTDAAGTLIGRRPGPPGAPTLLMGSHQDSIRNGGKYDGMLGVALPILVFEHLKGTELPLAVEILAFADEEGIRFPTAMVGPRALAGTIEAADLGFVDADGVSLAEALASFGGDPGALDNLHRAGTDLTGFLEVHIEQGPVLEKRGVPVGVVTGICGIERWTVKLTGVAAHAGTTPVALRRDALAGAAECVLAVEALCRRTDGLLGGVGTLEVRPGVANAVPGETEFSVELRAAEDAKRTAAATGLDASIRGIAERRALGVEIERTYAQPGVICDDRLTAILAEAVSETGVEVVRLPSGATHDASAMASLGPVAMLFVRCRGGVSHNPHESVTAADVEAAMNALVRFVDGLARATGA